ncbi:phage tail tape measure protein [Priestia megaterium]|uniref:phage tail tape measure protein n=1 Tax=Priestia megaterium TaxID=1404 RepID=UPI002877E43A|nr:phage tail tape measure protein [Priestia megaterium]
MSDIKILLSAQLDFNNTQNAVNKQIAALENKVSKLKINIDINDNAIKTMQKFARAVDDYKNNFKEFEKVAKQNDVVIKNADGTIDKYTKKILRNNEVMFQTTKTIDKRNKTIQQETKSIENNLKVLQREEELQKRVNKVKSDGKKATTDTYGDKYTKTSYKKDNSGKVVDQTTTQNIAKQQADVERLRTKLAQLNKDGVLSSTTFKNLSKSLDLSKSESQIKDVQSRLESVIKLQNNLNNQKVRDNKVSNFQSNFEVDAEKLKRQFRGKIDNGALEALRQQAKNLDSSLPSVSNRIKELQVQLKQLKMEATTSSTAFKALGEQSVDAFKKFSTWTLTGGAFFGILNSGKQLIDVITQVDAKMTDLKKVMSPATNFDSVLVDATARAKELGKEITSVLDAYGTFARQGFDDSQMKDMADAALIASNVGEMEAGQAAEYLTSAIVQYKMETKDAIGVVDAWNEVSNKNATTVNNLAQGWSKAGSISKQFGLDMNELNAAIGTVTAATKVSGNEAGELIAA